MDAEKTGRLIEEARKAKGMSQRVLAEKLHVSNTTISKYEHGTRFPDLSVLESLADALDITVSELIKGERQKIPDEEEQTVRDTVRQSAVEQESNNLRRSRRVTITVIGMILLILLIWYVQNHNHPLLTRQEYTETNAAYSMTSPAFELVLYRRFDDRTEIQKYRMDQDPHTESYRFLEISVTDQWLQFSAGETYQPVGADDSQESHNIPMTWTESVQAGKKEKLLGIDTAHVQEGTPEEIRESGNYDVLVTVRMSGN